MPARSDIPRLTDIVEAIERIHGVMDDLTLEAFEADWQRQWLVERGVEIISECLSGTIASIFNDLDSLCESYLMDSA